MFIYRHIPFVSKRHVKRAMTDAKMDGERGATMQLPITIVECAWER